MTSESKSTEQPLPLGSQVHRNHINQRAVGCDASQASEQQLFF